MKSKAMRRAALLISIIFVLAALSGCASWAKNDPVVLKFNTVEKRLSQYQNAYQNAYINAYYSGNYDVSTLEKLHAFQDQVLLDLTYQAAAEYNAENAEIVITEEELAKIEEEVDAELKGYVDGYKTDESIKTTDEAEIEAAALKLFIKDIKSQGYKSYENFRKILVDEYTLSKKIEKHSERLLSTVKVEDSEVKSQYDSLVSSAKTAYESTPAQFYADSLDSSKIFVYYSEDCVRVQYIRLDASNSDKKDEVMKAINLSKMTFKDIAAEYSKDTSGRSDTGIYVGPSSKDIYSEDFINAATALTEINQVSEPVETENGIYIIKLLELVKEGERPYSEVQEKLHESMLQQKKNERYDGIVKAWVADGKVTEYKSRIRNVGMGS